MDGFKAYRYYLALKLHFTTEKFNVFENRGNVKGSREAFNARNDRYIFEKVGSRFDDDKDIIQYFVANFAYNNDSFIYEGQQAEENYKIWIKRKESITKVFIDDLASIINHIEVNKIASHHVFNFLDSTYPVAFELLIGNKISIETIRILDDIYPMLDNWESHNAVKYIWNQEFLRIKKLTGFVKYDIIKIEKIFKHFMDEVAE